MKFLKLILQKNTLAAILFAVIGAAWGVYEYTNNAIAGGVMMGAFIMAAAWILFLAVIGFINWKNGKL